MIILVREVGTLDDEGGRRIREKVEIRFIWRDLFGIYLEVKLMEFADTWQCFGLKNEFKICVSR